VVLDRAIQDGIQVCEIAADARTGSLITIEAELEVLKATLITTGSHGSATHHRRMNIHSGGAPQSIFERVVSQEDGRTPPASLRSLPPG
jgi:hypothetical protein